MKKIITLLAIIFLISGCTIADSISNKFTKKDSIHKLAETKNNNVTTTNQNTVEIKKIENPTTTNPNTTINKNDIQKPIILVDTDNDGLSDVDEIYKYKTDPNNPDTDGDGYLDGEEIVNGYDPLRNAE